MNLLFIWSENRLRSPTGEEVFSAYEGIDAIGAGTNTDAPTPVSGDLIEWADIVFLSAMIVQQESLKKVVKLCKQKGKRVAVGGPYVSTNAEDLADVDFIFVGEAETALRIEDLGSSRPCQTLALAGIESVIVSSSETIRPSRRWIVLSA